jgi:hypothetical protein
MAKIEVKQVRATMTHGEMEPHWEVVVSYGSVEVVIPLPARQLPTDDWPQSHRESIEAIKRIARALINEILHGVLVFFPLSPFLHLSFDDVSIHLSVLGLSRHRFASAQQSVIPPAARRAVQALRGIGETVGQLAEPPKSG